MSHKRQFHLSSRRRVHELLVRACGRFTLGHGALEALWTRHIERAGHRAVTLDLACVNDMDARGLGVLASLTRELAAAGRIVSVSAASGAVARLLTLTRLDGVLYRGKVNAVRWLDAVSSRHCDQSRGKTRSSQPFGKQSGRTHPTELLTELRHDAEGFTLMRNENELPIACTLEGSSYQARLAWIADLAREGMRGHRRDDLTLELHYASAVASRVRDMVRKEQECCAFLSFDVSEDGDAVRLKITAPERARAAADALFEQFLPPLSVSTASTPAARPTCCGDDGETCR